MEMLQYQVSYVVEGGGHPGAFVRTDREPQVGDVVRLDGAMVEVTEITELMPPDGDFGLIHATCRLVRYTK
jgi:hypothetical protein